MSHMYIENDVSKADICVNKLSGLAHDCLLWQAYTNWLMLAHATERSD